MASHGYRQPYRQGPAPSLQQQRQQQPYHQNQYDRMNQYGGQQERNYQQQSYDYNQYEPTQNRDQYDNHYGYDGGQFGNEPHHEPAYRDQYDEQFQQYDADAGRQQSYQYDDNHYSNGPTSPSAQYQQMRPLPHAGPPRHPAQNAQYVYASNASGVKPSKARERILQEPESPKTSSWDNPFPTFPSKKKAVASKKTESQETQPLDRADSGHSQDRQRPSTSHSTRQHAEPPRLHTSHSQGRLQPLRSPTSPPDMPLRNDAAYSRTQQNTPQSAHPDGPAHRAAPRRAMTGPVPQQATNDFSREQQSYYEDQQRDFIDADRRPQQYHEARPLPQRQMQNDIPPTPTHHSNSGRHQRRSSDNSYRAPLPPNVDVERHDSASYRGVPLAKKTSPDVPNFDAISGDATERLEGNLGLFHQPKSSARQQPPPSDPSQAYRKPAYQQGNSARSDSQSYQSHANANDLASPLAQFSFDLPRSEQNGYSSNMHPNRNNHRSQSGEQNHSSAQHTQQSGYVRPNQYPVRSQSRPEDLPHGAKVSAPFPTNNLSMGSENSLQNTVPQNSSRDFPPNRTSQGYQGVPPVRPGLVQPPPNSRYSQEEFQRNDYNDLSYDPNSARGHNQRPGMPPSQTSYQSDMSRQGYDSRIQPHQGSSSPPQSPAFRQALPRPPTSTSINSAPYSDPRQSGDNYQRNGMQNPNSLPAHPAPFRPGLMQVAPPPQQPPPQPRNQPVSHQRAPSGPKPPTDQEPPVTIRELNALREEYKTHPENHPLGLKFAKRLVEAAKVLASENGRADPKQTAKNRERYIFDAHKVVKRLCGVGYADAMFYLADCYGQGLLGLEPDPKEAFSLYQSAAKLGHAQAAYRVAVCCELGSEEGGGTRRDPLKSVQWYKRAASLGDTPAMYKMGMIQLKGLLGQPKNPREAISWLKRASERADADNPHALHELGLLYENAQSTDVIIKDEKYALQLFQQAADLGYKYSQFRLGTAYEYGLLGLPIDPRMSIAWYSRAARQGEHQAEFALSGWYLTGSGQAPAGEQPLLQQSDVEAYLWAKKAASSGLAKAEYAMGYYTEVGIGIASNIEEAKRWYYRAAAQDYPKARERLEDLKRGGQRMQKTRVSRSNVGKHNEGECVVM